MHRVWAVLLSAYLLAWVPLGFASEALGAAASLGMRGLPAIVELVLHGMAAAFCAAAGWMVRTGAPAAPGFASVAVLAAGCTSLQSLFWTALPRQLAPGSQLPLAAVVIAHTIFWLVLLRRARAA